MNIYAFIDSQNLNLSILELGWRLDFARFRVYLKDKYNVNKIFLFIGYILENEKLYYFLRRAGYILIFKPTLIANNEKIAYIKGNVDAELVLHSMVEFSNYDKAIIVSGDGDFYCLIEYLENRGKLHSVLIPNPRKFSALLRRFWKYIIFIDFLRKKLGKQ
ncbi:MAG: NYN domain-containing protein [Candidatus Gracilibacteria bacterium]|jgi:uncharacterized LabA/DUF88 family protein